MRWCKRVDLAVASAVIAFGSTTLSAQVDSASSALRGRIIDARSTQALTAVVVVLTLAGDTIGRAQTDSGGAFVIRSRPATQIVAHFTRIGYRADSVQTEIGGSSGPLRVAMTPLGTQTIASLGPTKIVAANGTTDFDRRVARHVGGIFITEAEIEKRRPVRTSDLFRALLGVAVRDSGGVQQLVSNRTVQSSSTPTNAGRAVVAPKAGGGTPLPTTPSGTTDDGSRGPTVDGRKCVLRIGIDGQLMDQSFSIDEIPVQAVRGVEAYLGPATIPVEFSTMGPDAPCGIVMVWTRDGRRRAP